MTTNSNLAARKTPVQIGLDQETIVILGDVLTNLTDKMLENNEIDQSQAMALWQLENAIESVCTVSFRPDYVNILAEVKNSMGELK